MSSASLYDKNIKEQQPKGNNYLKNKLISDNWIVSSVSVHGESTTTISPDGERFPRNNKKRKFHKFQ